MSEKNFENLIMPFNEICYALNGSCYYCENLIVGEMDNFEMYKEIFEHQPLEKEMGKKNSPEEYGYGEYVLIATLIKNGVKGRKIKTRLIFDGLAELKKIINENKYDHHFLSPISFCGRNAKRENARYMYALVIDLDNLRRNKKRYSNITNEYYAIRMLDYYIGRKWLWVPSYIVASGHGIHLYYVFEKPVPLYGENLNLMYELKKKIIERVWNTDIVIEESKIQYGNSIQNFRIAGTKSKIKGINTQAFRGEKEYYTPYMLAERTLMTAEEKNQYKEMISLDTVTRAEAKRYWPDWYQRVVVEKKEPKRWHIKRALYDWYLREIKEKAQVSHRYYCCLNLVAYAKKCDIDYEELKKDLMELLPILDAKTIDKTNHFTINDINAALSCYDTQKMWNYKKKYMEQNSGFEFPKNKRNYRKQKDHLRIMNFTRQLAIENGVKMGRPVDEEKKEKVFYYLKNGGDKKIKEIMKNCNVSKPTAIKYRKMYESMI